MRQPPGGTSGAWLVLKPFEGLEDEDGWHVASGAVQLLPDGRRGLVLVVLADGQPTAEGGFALTSAPATIAIQEVANLR